MPRSSPRRQAERIGEDNVITSREQRPHRRRVTTRERDARLVILLDEVVQTPAQGAPPSLLGRVWNRSPWRVTVDRRVLRPHEGHGAVTGSGSPRSS